MNLANKITIIRILLVPIFVFFLLMPFPYGKFISALIFVAAASTDWIDGYIARKRNQVTNFGKFMDPLADKLLVTSALISLVELGSVPSWAAIIIVSREFMVTSLRIVAASEGIVIAASKWGKIKTVTQMIAIVSLLIQNYPFSLIGFPFDKISMLLAVIFTILSGIDYLWKNRRILDFNV